MHVITLPHPLGHLLDQRPQSPHSTLLWALGFLASLGSTGIHAHVCLPTLANGQC